MKTIVVASSNAGKLKEFKEMLEPKGYQVLGLKDIDQPIEIEENGTTFQENAILKAQSVTNALGLMAISDDSGLEIDAFDGQPGIYSARWLGHDTSYMYKNQVVLERMKNEKNRRCRYVCAMAITRPGQQPVVFEDTVECVIADAPHGLNGFGYDPIVYYPPLQKTMAQMTPEEKNEISHRGKVVRKVEAWLQQHEQMD